MAGSVRTGTHQSILNSDGQRHPVQNVLTIFTLVVGLMMQAVTLSVWLLLRQPSAMAAIRAGRGDLISGGVFPLIGVLFSVTVLVGSFWSGAVSAVVIAYGLGSIVIGAGVALILRLRRVPFFVAAGSPWSPIDRRFP